MPSKTVTEQDASQPAKPTTERRAISLEDMALLMALKAESDSHAAAIHAIEHTHNMLLTNLATRYNTPASEGWAMQDYVTGFTRTVSEAPNGRDETS